MQLRRFGLSWSAGGYEDQPCILVKEINAVCEEMEDHDVLKRINRENRDK